MVLWILRCMYFFEIWFCPDICLGVGLLDHMAILFLVLWSTSVLFSIVGAWVLNLPCTACVLSGESLSLAHSFPKMRLWTSLSLWVSYSQVPCGHQETNRIPRLRRDYSPWLRSTEVFWEKYYTWGFWGRVMDLKGEEGRMQCISCNEVLKGEGGSQFLERSFLRVNLRRWGTNETFENLKEVLYIVGYVVQLPSHVWLLATPWTVAHQAPLSMGILQARTLEWVAMPSSRGSSQPRHRTLVSHIAGRFFTVWDIREALNSARSIQSLPITEGWIVVSVNQRKAWPWEPFLEKVRLAGWKWGGGGWQSSIHSGLNCTSRRWLLLKCSVSWRPTGEDNVAKWTRNRNVSSFQGNWEELKA